VTCWPFQAWPMPILRWRKLMWPADETRSKRGPVWCHRGCGSPERTLGRADYRFAGGWSLRLWCGRSWL
jgi:hypothetical protein